MFNDHIFNGSEHQIICVFVQLDVLKFLYNVQNVIKLQKNDADLQKIFLIILKLQILAKKYYTLAKVLRK